MMTRVTNGPSRIQRRSESILRRPLLALSLLVVTSFAQAFQPITPQQQISHAKVSHAFVSADEIEVQPELEQTTSLTTSDAHAGVTNFIQRNSGDWEMRWDRRSDRPNLVQGSGIALIPGRGNSLSASQLGLAANETIDMAVVETRLKDFIDANSDLLKSKGLEFRLDPNSSIPYGKDNSHWFVEFAQYKDGVRVEGANLFFRIAAGNIIQFGANEVAPVAIDVQPVSTRDAAFALVMQELAFPAGTTVQNVIEPGELLLVPVTPAGQTSGESYRGTAGKGYEHRLVWRFVFRVNDDRTTYQVLADAHTNRVIDMKDLNEYVNATVTGGIYPTTNTDAEVVVPMPFAAVTNGGAKVTDVLGIYDYSGGTATTTLNGKYFTMHDDCGAISLSNTTNGNLALGTSGGTDCTTPGVGGVGNTHASRSGFYHLTNINRKAITFFPSNAWLQGTVTAEMNENSVCNAFWDGTQLNFFKSGSGCSNTGEIAAVFLHEWGHGMDTNSGGSAPNDYGSGEAVGDTFAFLETKDACIGKNFQPGVPCDNCAATCTGVRDLNSFSTLGAHTVAKPSLIADNNGINCDAVLGLNNIACPYNRPDNGQAYRGPMGYEGHCESYIASSANWDLAQKLVAVHGQTGWGEMDKIWYGSLTPSKSAYRIASGGTCNPAAQIDGCGANNWYTVYLAADDDDGNLANGTPNGCRIWDAFTAHGIACGARPVCSADAPDFTLTITETTQSICAPGTTTYTINVGTNLGFSAPVTLAATGLPAGVSASFSTNPVTPGGTSTMTITATGAAVAGTSTLTVNGTATGSGGHSATSQLVLTTGAPTAPVLSGPANGATGTSTAPTLSWAASPNTASYTLEIATDPGFGTIVQTIPNLTTTSSAVTGLAPITTYYWRVKAINTCGSTTSSVFSFTTANMICHAPNVAIPDNNATGVTDTITVSDPSTLTGLKVIIRATHTYVGDLAFTLSKGAGSSIVIDRPGVPATANGCTSNDIDVTLDDAAATLVENQCNATPPAIAGVQKPNNPINSVFAGQSLAGTWTLKATDAAAQDIGNLTEWCLVPTTAAGTTFTVGGNATGVTGSGLVLSLNSGAQTLPVAASGAFTFPTGLATGATYAVTVGTQPSGQTCSVTNGSGTIASANVTNVAVSCTASTYTVGGTVSGLSGTGLVLSLGAQSLPISANGAFTFPTALASGASYAVTVGTQPSGPLQTCTVTNGSGTIGSANVTNVTVACATSTFTVGGSVSGLSGTGLVLSLGAQSLPVSTNGSFVFPTALASGASYAVTVGTQPSGPTQICTVTNGSGTIGSANVTNVTVVCATSTFTVGGSVSGLSGSGLVLSLGAQSLPVSASGTFTFPTALASGASYAVTVGTQPSGPSQTCTVTNGSGTIGSTNVTNVTVACATNNFTVGGTVSGLLGNNVTLSLNAGAQTQVVATNGSFAFPTALASGAAYAVTVSVQPASPTEVCTITNGAGTIAASNVSNVTVSCIDRIFGDGFDG